MQKKISRDVETWARDAWVPRPINETKTSATKTADIQAKNDASLPTQNQAAAPSSSRIGRAVHKEPEHVPGTPTPSIERAHPAAADGRPRFDRNGLRALLDACQRREADVRLHDEDLEQVVTELQAALMNSPDTRGERNIEGLRNLISDRASAMDSALDRLEPMGSNFAATESIPEATPRTQDGEPLSGGRSERGAPHDAQDPKAIGDQALKTLAEVLAYALIIPDMDRQRAWVG